LPHQLSLTPELLGDLFGPGIALIDLGELRERRPTLELAASRARIVVRIHFDHPTGGRRSSLHWCDCFAHDLDRFWKGRKLEMSHYRGRRGFRLLGFAEA
jgi:hypothetical protein